jgi:hypothetical protein
LLCALAVRDCRGGVQPCLANGAGRARGGRVREREGDAGPAREGEGLVGCRSALLLLDLALANNWI